MSDTKSEAREFWIACPEFGDFDYCEATVSKDPECVEREGDFKFSALHVIEMSTYQDLKAKHGRVLQMLEIAEAELKDARDFAMDTLARANQAIETDCDKCDYQCQGCIRAIDDAEAVKYNISIALEKIKSLK